MKNIYSKATDFVLDILFPISCIGCQKEGFWICEPCLSKIKLISDHVCPICEKMDTPDGCTCLPCKKKSSLAGMIVSSSYKNELIAKAIHFFKYRFIQDLSEPLGKILVKSLLSTNIPLPDIIIPIPLHCRRLRWRGFNQSELLANFISQNLLPGVSIETNIGILRRKKYTLPQMHLKNFQARKKNIKNAFDIMENEKIKNKTILLVDDVATTGSTILECARLLKKAGASEVFAIVIARQETKARNI